MGSMPEQPTTGVTGLVLAGGRGARMGGIDKGLMDYRGRPMIATVTKRLAGQVDRMIISCNRNRDSYVEYADSVVSDLRADFQGPLAGIESCISRAEGSYLAVVACDAPELPLDLVQRLLLALPETHGAAFAHDGMREQYLFAVIRQTVLGTLPGYLDAGGRSLKGWYRGINAIAVGFGDQAHAFANINEA